MEPRGGDGKIDEDAADVNEGSDEGCAGGSGVEAEGAEEKRKEQARHATKEDDAAHRGTDDDGNIHAATEESQEGDRSSHAEAEDEADDELAADDAPPGGGAGVTDGECADHEGGGLRAGITTAADEEGEERDESKDFADGFFEDGHAGAGKDVDEDQADEPADALAIKLEKGGITETDFDGVDLAEFLEVFGGFLLDDVEDVVNRDDAEKDVISVDDGQGVEARLLKERDSFFLILRGAEADVLAIHKGRDRGGGRGEEDLTQGDIIQEMAALINHVEHHDSFAIRAMGADMGENAGDVPGGLDREVGRGHEAAHTVFWVVEEGERFAAFVVGEECEEALGNFGGKFFEEGGTVVGAEPVEDIAHFVLGEARDEEILGIGAEE